MVKIIQADREAAWPLRPECYTERDYERWMSGLYDNNNVGINRLATHRIQSTADLQAKLDKAVKALGDSQATLASIRAATVGEDWGEQSTSEHIHDLCGETMRLNMAVIEG